MPMYSDFISVKRRYTRSVNLERDIKIPDSIDGYIPTARSIDGLTRFINSFSHPHSVKAWTLTGAYGTGKSAFAHFLTILSGEHDDYTRKKASNILRSVDSKNELAGLFDQHIPEKGLLRAIVTAQREPIANTIVRSLYNGAILYWGNALGRKPDAYKEIIDLNDKINKGKDADAKETLNLFKESVRASKFGILLIIDELGKNLEYSAHNQSVDDLYLLQQIAELPTESDEKNVFVFGLLHQAFVDYAQSIGSEQRKEWAKIQGRFEDIPFIEAPDRMVQLIGNAIEKSEDTEIKNKIVEWSKQWSKALSEYDTLNSIDFNGFYKAFPIHPLTTSALPILCSKFSQNDRTLFTFLASEEPNSFVSFLKNTKLEDDRLSCLKLFNLYDYFIEAAGISFSMRPQFQRWIEVHSRVMDAKHIEPYLVNILKTIGILNLISTTGSLRASKETVCLAMCDSPNDSADLDHFEFSVQQLIKKGFLTYRKQIDELRIWEGSDIDIEEEVQNQSQLINISLAKLLNEYFPLKPLIAQRHSYQSGNLRYFERIYHDDISNLKEISCKSSDIDGIIIYWLGDFKDFKKIDGVPIYTVDEKPVLVICANELKALNHACYEYTALKRINANSRQLQSDSVAKREVSQRLLYTEKILEETLNRSFDITSKDVGTYCLGRRETYKSWSSFQNDLSATLDLTYNRGLRLWNELINRRQLTSQGAAARHKLIAAMIENEGEERLGIVGNGPEYSMFESMLLKTGLYRESDTGWVFDRPNDDPAISNIWGAIEDFCKSAEDKPINVSLLYEKLSKPPYGVKDGPIPILLLSVLQYHSEYVSIYIDGNFIPVIGSEHFELFYRKPERFSVKYFNLTGLKAQLFHELEGIFTGASGQKVPKHRNKTVLSVVKPIISFIGHLPQYTINSEEALSKRARAVRQAILTSKEPDTLLFEDLPRACGLSEFSLNQSKNKTLIKSFRLNLAQALKELQTNYDNLLSDCKKLIYDAFKISSDIQKIREDLRVRASYLHGQVVEDQLRRLILAAINEEDSDKVWLETLVMVIADKPPRVWKDRDRLVFESKLNDIARRFKNLESLQKEMARDNRTGYIARKVTITKPDGKDLSHFVWIDTEQKEKINKIAQAIYDENEELIDVLAALLVEKTVNSKKKESEKEPNPEKKVKKIGS